MIYIVDSRGVQVALETWMIALFIGLIVLFAVGLYLLRSFGVYKLAKAQKMTYAYMAFIPGMWMYPACKLCAEARFFRTTIGRVALVFAIIFSASVLLSLAYNLVYYIPLVGYYLGGGEKILIADSVELTGEVIRYADNIYLGTDFVDPYVSLVAQRGIDSLYWIYIIVDAIASVCAIFMYCALFRKYWPEYFLVSVLCSVIGLFPIFVFIIRNKPVVDWNEYVKRRSGRYGNPYGGQNPYGQNPYGQNPYGNNQWQNQQQSRPKPNDDPFADFDQKKNNDDPFSDFENKDN